MCPMFNTNYDDINDDDPNHEERVTWPPPGSASLKVFDRFEPMFYTATWTVSASVNDKVLYTSYAADKPHSDSFIKRWARQLIRTHYEHLRSLGVDAEDEYVKLGGELADLE